MAKKRIKEAKPATRCRDCQEAYDYHEIGYDGKPFMCRCRHEEFSRFLTDYSCAHFIPKT